LIFATLAQSKVMATKNIKIRESEVNTRSRLNLLFFRA